MRQPCCLIAGWVGSPRPGSNPSPKQKSIVVYTPYLTHAPFFILGLACFTEKIETATGTPFLTHSPFSLYVRPSPFL